MASVNKVILVGNCGRYPEVRYLSAYVRVVRSGRLKASDLTATEPFGNHYEDFALRYFNAEQVFVEKVPSSTPTAPNRSDCGQNKLGKRVPTSHSSFSRSTSFFGSSKANKRNAP